MGSCPQYFMVRLEVLWKRNKEEEERGRAVCSSCGTPNMLQELALL